MRNDDLNESGPPYEPGTPEEFVARGESEFQSWWDELDPPSCCGGVRLDRDTARVVWIAAYEHEWTATALVYDSAEAHAGSAKTTAEIELGFVVSKYHNGSISFPPSNFIDWIAEHETRIRREIEEREDSITIRILRLKGY